MAWEVDKVSTFPQEQKWLWQRILFWRTIRGELCAVATLSSVSILSAAGFSTQVGALLLDASKGASWRPVEGSFVKLLQVAQDFTRTFSLAVALACAAVGLTTELALRRARARLAVPVRHPYHVAGLCVLSPGPFFSPVPPVVAAFMFQHLERCSTGERRELLVGGAWASCALLAVVRSWWQTARRLTALSDSFSLLPDGVEQFAGMLRLAWMQALPPSVCRLRVMYQALDDEVSGAPCGAYGALAGCHVTEDVPGELELQGLRPGTTYELCVVAEDACGAAVVAPQVTCAGRRELLWGVQRGL
jgi:hypothetical protein